MVVLIGLFAGREIVWCKPNNNNQQQQQQQAQQKQQQSQAAAFQCPEQFGYYTDARDCTKYYVCVFGEVLHESCTGGLRFSRELQTCDWPRNVDCPNQPNETTASSSSNNEIITTTTTSSSAASAGSGSGSGSSSGSSTGTTLASTQLQQLQQQQQQQLNQLQPLADQLNGATSSLQFTAHPQPHGHAHSVHSLLSSQSVAGPQLGPHLSHSHSQGHAHAHTHPQTQTQSLTLAQTQSHSLGQNQPQTITTSTSFASLPQLLQQQQAQQRRPRPPKRQKIPGASARQQQQQQQSAPPQSPAPPRSRPPLQQLTSFEPAPELPPVATTSTESSLSETTSARFEAELITALHNEQQFDPAPGFAAQQQQQSQSQQQQQSQTQSSQTQLVQQQPMQQQHTQQTQQLQQQTTQLVPLPQQNTNRAPKQHSSGASHAQLQLAHQAPSAHQHHQHQFTHQSLNLNQNLNSNQNINTNTNPNLNQNTNQNQNANQNQNINQNANQNINQNTNQQPAKKPRPTNKKIVVDHEKALANNRASSEPARRPDSLYSTPTAGQTAAKCSAHKCRLPDCKCADTLVPAALDPKLIPQVVLLTFDDAVNDLNWEIYEELFSGRTNPNGCPILATFYVSHEWTDYGQVQTLYSRGHEMASHSVTHSFGEKFSKSQWFKEINGQREILNMYGGVKMQDVRGMRAPFLQIGGNKMFEMLYDANFTYDSSMPIFENSPPLWPYTLDYQVSHECMITPCPTKSYPGVWEVGMTMWVDLRGGRCSMGDACSNPADEDGVYEMLMKNFNRHYKSNRAPFGLFYHSAWFNTVHHRRGFLRFLTTVNSLSDVFFVTNWQMIQWIRQPTPLSEINSFEPWQCPAKNERPPPCYHPSVCNVKSEHGKYSPFFIFILRLSWSSLKQQSVLILQS